MIHQEPCCHAEVKPINPKDRCQKDTHLGQEPITTSLSRLAAQQTVRRPETGQDRSFEKLSSLMYRKEGVGEEEIKKKTTLFTRLQLPSKDKEEDNMGDGRGRSHNETKSLILSGVMETSKQKYTICIKPMTNVMLVSYAKRGVANWQSDLSVNAGKV